ncbi:PTS sugar transporter subunit IIA [Companilactobacillus nuruki]|nr:PTS sugar transporter subunit IIA [Companilactobacillus nuruki]
MINTDGFGYMVKSELIDLNIDAANEDDVFNYVAEQLKSNDYVNDGYLEAIKTREEKFPTGLLAPKITLAVPHVDAEYIKKPFVFIGKTTEPIDIKQMAINKDMQTDNFCFLGIKDGKGQAGLLKNIIYALRDDEFIDSISNANDNIKIFNTYVKFLNKNN